MCEMDNVARIIIPPEEAKKILRRTEKIYLRNCPCRVSTGSCSTNQLDVCMLFDGASQDDLLEGHSISQREALLIMEDIAASRLIHNLFYNHDTGELVELCNCCTCCCEPLHDLKENGDYDRQIRSEYIAVTDELLCKGCGTCLESCYFEARQLIEGSMKLVDERCFGCGRCIDTCPEKAIRLEVQFGRGIPIPIGMFRNEDFVG
jgi:Na+-translocating ferredoxin:NAD+ oxidoreductase subunit B